MGLLSPAPGECYDRLAIVRLKIAFCTEKKEFKLQLQFEAEMLELLDCLNRRWQALDFEAAPLLTASKLNKQFVQFAALEKIHKQLWDLESERRKLMRIPTEGGAKDWYYQMIGRNAEKTTLLNDERQRLITEVNAAFGVNGTEKLYALECDGQLCAGCGKRTGWICPFCTLKKVWLCESEECREKHEAEGCARKSVNV